MPKNVIIYIYKAYSKFIFLKIISYIEAERVVSIVMYIPVAVATRASTPNISRTGANINPGPMPLKPAAIDPANAIAPNFNTFSDVASKSPGTNG